MTAVPIVLVHAFPLDHRLWVAQSEALEAAGYSVLAPDLPGLGTAPLAIGEPSLTAYADAVLAAADGAGFDRFVLGGLSLGGYVAMAVLRVAPQRVAGLILADTRATADLPEAAENRRVVADQVEAAGDTRALARAMMPNLVGATTTNSRPEVVEVVRGWIEENSAAGVAWAQRAMAVRPDSLDDLAAFAGPALIVWGEEDTLTGRAEQDLMVDSLNDVELAVIPEAGHLSAIERPDAVTGVLLDFLMSLN